MFTRELTLPVTRVRGVGEATAAAFRKVEVETIADLLLYLPRDYQDRSRVVTLREVAAALAASPYELGFDERSRSPGGPAAGEPLPEGSRAGRLPARPATPPPVNTVVTVVSHHFIGRGRNRTLKVIVEESLDEAGATPSSPPSGGPPRDDPFGPPPARGALLCFGRSFLERSLEVGKRFALYGSFAYRYGELSSSAFEMEPLERRTEPRILPIYPLTEGLPQGVVRRAVASALATSGVHVESELPQGLMRRRELLGTAKALVGVHRPESLEGAEAARRSLAYEELFYLQLTIARRALRRRSERRQARALSTRLQERLVERLPFRLTPDQQTVLGEINADLAGSRPMARLLQGEVGSGKTLVALLAALAVIENGEQAALMAPTELLARQHAESAARLLSPLGIRLAYLSGNVKDASRALLLEALGRGEIDLVVGTHALFTRGVSFRRLGLAIVDEQHRFGVVQRLALVSKGEEPDLLLMTATPIPRTLALTLFADLDLSTIRTMPAGRRPIITHLARAGNAQKVYAWVRRELTKGRQAYFVYPLIQQSESLDLKDAESMYEELARAVFPDRRVGLIHSRLDEEEKSSVMAAFVGGGIDILVATSVVEVGVDVPNATVMVIEHAERFGLAALHQLRGRVGRGGEQSYAFLIYGEELTEEGKQRLKALKETTDGFRIAEEDLRLRGPGEIAGMRQSGYLRLRVADIVADFELLKMAREDALALLSDDPGLLKPENRPVRELLERAPPFSDEILAGY